MSRILYDFLTESFLLDPRHLQNQFAAFSDEQLRQELNLYREYVDRSRPALFASARSRPDELLVFQGERLVPVAALKRAAFYVEAYLQADPLLYHAMPVQPDFAMMAQVGNVPLGAFHRGGVVSALNYMRDVQPMVAGGYVRFLPLEDPLKHLKPLDLLYSESSFADVLNREVLTFMRSAARVERIRSIGGGHIQVRPNTELVREIQISFDPGASDAFCYQLMEQELTDYDPVSRQGTMSYRMPSTPPDAESFDAWVNQSVNLAAISFVERLARDLSVAEAVGAVYATPTARRKEVLDLLGHPRDMEVASVANMTMELELPFLEHIDSETLMAIRVDERAAFQAFRDELERKFREVRAVTDADVRARKMAEVERELTVNQVREADRRIRQLRTGALRTTSIGALAFAATVQSPGLSIFALLAAAFQGYHTFADYRAATRLLPGYFLLKLKGSA